MSNSVLKSFVVGCKQVGYMLRAMCLKLSTKLLKLLFPYLNTHTHTHTADKTSSRELEEALSCIIIQASSSSITIAGLPEINFLKPPQNNRNTHTCTIRSFLSLKLWNFLWYLLAKKIYRSRVSRV
jgi:hypothetical protein